MLCPYCKKVIANDVSLFLFEKSYEDIVKSRLNRGYIANIPERYRSYECPRCRGKFSTKEILYQINPRYKLSARGIRYYEKKKLIENIPVRQNVSQEVQDLILKVFGEDIKRDIELDLKELERRKRNK